MHAAGGPDEARGSDTVDATASARSPEVPDDQAPDTPSDRGKIAGQTPPVRHQRGARFPSAARRRRWSEPEQQPETAAVAEEAIGEQPAAVQQVSEGPITAQPITAQPIADELIADERVAATGTRPSPRVRATAAAEVPAVAPVRPYVLTRGRTRASHEFALETLVSSSQDPARLGMVDGEEHRAVLVLCVRPRSVVEVAAMLGVPLGVARVLLGDLADIGAVTVHRTVGPGGPDLALMSRVLEGLRRL